MFTDSQPPKPEQTIKRIDALLPDFKKAAMSPDGIIEELAEELYLTAEPRLSKEYPTRWVDLKETHRYFFRCLAETAYRKLYIALARIRTNV